MVCIKISISQQKDGTSLVLKSDLEGAGKNIIFDFIAENLLVLNM